LESADVPEAGVEAQVEGMNVPEVGRAEGRCETREWSEHVCEIRLNARHSMRAGETMKKLAADQCAVPVGSPKAHTTSAERSSHHSRFLA